MTSNQEMQTFLDRTLSGLTSGDSGWQGDEFQLAGQLIPFDQSPTGQSSRDALLEMVQSKYADAGLAQPEAVQIDSGQGMGLRVVTFPTAAYDSRTAQAWIEEHYGKTQSGEILEVPAAEIGEFRDDRQVSYRSILIPASGPQVRENATADSVEERSLDTQAHQLRTATDWTLY